MAYPLRSGTCWGRWLAPCIPRFMHRLFLQPLPFCQSNRPCEFDVRRFPCRLRCGRHAPNPGRARARICQQSLQQSHPLRVRAGASPVWSRVCRTRHVVEVRCTRKRGKHPDLVRHRRPLVEVAWALVSDGRAARKSRKAHSDALLSARPSARAMVRAAGEDKPSAECSCEVALAAAELLQKTLSRRRVAELEGPRRVTPIEVAATFTRLLGQRKLPGSRRASRARPGARPTVRRDRSCADNCATSPC